MSSTTTGGDAGNRERSIEPLQPDKSLGELFGEMTSELAELFRSEVQLAKLETEREVAKAGRAAGMAAGAVLGVWLAVLLLSLAAAWLLDDVMNRALAFLVVALAWAAISAVLGLVAMKSFRTIRPDLPDTKQTLKEDAQWARAQKP